MYVFIFMFVGIIWLSCNSKESLIEKELLPLCWEELNHKYIERRLLISELCCSVTPYVSVISIARLITNRMASDHYCCLANNILKDSVKSDDDRNFRSIF